MFACLLLTGAIDLARVAERVQPSVVRISVRDGDRELGSGSGFFISQTGEVVTNWHVVRRAKQLKIETADRTMLDAALPHLVDDEHDLAVLKVSGGDRSFPGLELGEPREVGSDVLVVGHPFGGALSFSSGAITSSSAKGLAPRGYDVHRKLEGWRLEISAAIAPGYSGSPVVDSDGLVIGVAVGMFRDGEHQNYAVPVELVHALLTQPPKQPWSFTGPSVFVNLVISLFVFALIAYLIRSPKKRARRPVQSRHEDVLRDRWIM